MPVHITTNTGEPTQHESQWTETFGCQRNMRSDNFKEDQIRRKRSFGRSAYHELFHGVVSMRLALSSLEFKFVISRLNNSSAKNQQSRSREFFGDRSYSARVNVSSVINRASKTAEQIGIR
jgi:hypothetical protein